MRCILFERHNRGTGNTHKTTRTALTTCVLATARRLTFADVFLSPQLSLRGQQVADKLNEWSVFSDKYKELCEWLTGMESKVSQNGDVSIEEMIERLRKVRSARFGSVEIFRLNILKTEVCRLTLPV